MSITIGRLDDWEQGDLGSSDYTRLEEGSNVGRIFTKPYQFYVIWTKDPTGKKVKFKTPVEGCVLVEKGLGQPKPQWLIGWYNRKTNKPELLEIGPQIYKGIKGLSKKEHWGQPTQYDLDIERMKPGSQPLYVVSPLPKTPLTDQEKATVKEFAEKTDFMALIQPPSREEVMEQMGMAEDKTEVSNEFDDLDNNSDDTDDDDFDFDNL